MEVEEAMLIEMKYCCKLCHKRFPCGRSLGGHMRSHLIANPSHSPQRKVNTTLQLKNNREKPNKTWRADPADEDPFQGTNPFCCNECGKGFHSSKALSGHMKSHRLLAHNHIINSSRPRRSNRRPMISSNINNGSSSSSVSEIDQIEQEEVAMCLILLSRDNIDDEYTTSGCVVKVKSGEEHEVSGVELSSKRSKYECSSCNKSFHSHQALGGHKASHNKAKLGSTMLAQGIGSHKHECPICFKVFASGQALGGHKRSHVIAQSRFDSNPIRTTTTASNLEARDFLDLNQPAPVEDGCSQLHPKPCWVGSTTKHDHLVGII